jgi:hypothetical protein
MCLTCTLWQDSSNIITICVIPNHIRSKSCPKWDARMRSKSQKWAWGSPLLLEVYQSGIIQH